ncbi:MAG: hypothetical protein M1821_002045 [Bathelium mastoideum]|nr:MAG: hypothetical protein M1821_002045 [Bathelium mastoideum]
MSQEYAGQDPLKLAQQAEADLNSTAAKQGHDASHSSRHGKGASDSSMILLPSASDSSSHASFDPHQAFSFVIMRATLSIVQINRIQTSNLNETARFFLSSADNSIAAESGVDESVRQKFPGAEVTYGSAASGAGDNREIPLSEGGEINPATGQPTKARDFEGPGGLAEKAQALAEENPGSDDVQSNVRQGG